MANNFKNAEGEIERSRNAVRAAASDWFTLPPKYRTKEKLLELVDDAVRDAIKDTTP